MSENIIEGVGPILAKAREDKGLSIADVAGKLKLTPRQIEAIEAEDMAKLPAPVFVRGFVRNYARLLDVPTDSLPGVAAEAAVQPTETITAHSEDVVIRNSSVRRWLLLPLAALALFVVLVAVLYNWLRQGEEAYLPSSSAQATTRVQSVELPAVQPAPLPAASEAPADVQAAAAVPEAAKPATAPQPADAGGQAGSAPSPAAPQAAPAPSVPAAPVTPAMPPASVAPHAYEFGDAMAAGHVARISVVGEESWVEVVSSDGKRYTQTLQPGEKMTVHGVPPLQVVIGNGGHATLSYDGRPVDLKPFTGDKVARLTLK